MVSWRGARISLARGCVLSREYFPSSVHPVFVDDVLLAHMRGMSTDLTPRGVLKPTHQEAAPDSLKTDVEPLIASIFVYPISRYKMCVCSFSWIYVECELGMPRAPWQLTLPGPFTVHSPHSHSFSDAPLLTRKVTRSSAIAEWPRDASCQLKSCQLPRNSAETRLLVRQVLNKWKLWS